ncbi:MAG: hypothetical protein HC930_02905 [Hydrococcus sp. SU_1_0]|nr:hypothetical protein [Hydrococcus sp. SU_1_0]
MVVKYLDPYKDDLYGKLRGDKSDTYCKATFDEANVYKTEDSYVIAAYVIAYEGITRNYKPENPLTPGLCAIPVYGKEYEIRRKDGENWVSDKVQPSKFEQALYKNIEAHESIWMPSNAAISGSITFLPDGMLASMDDATIAGMVAANSQTNPTSPTGKLPVYTPPAAGGQRKGYGGKSYGLSPGEKILFLKKQICSDIAASGFTVENSLPLLISQVNVEHPMDAEQVQTYFDLLTACIK